MDILQKQSTIPLPKHEVANYSDGLKIKTAVGNNCNLVCILDRVGLHNDPLLLG